jgi:hypothetical protein
MTNGDVRQQLYTCEYIPKIDMCTVFGLQLQFCLAAFHAINAHNLSITRTFATLQANYAKWCTFSHHRQCCLRL